MKALGLAAPFVYPDPRLELLRARGAEHERRWLERLRAEGNRVIAFDDLPKEDRNPAGLRPACGGDGRRDA